MSEKEVSKATSHLQISIEEHKSNDSVIIHIPESLKREVWSKCCIQRVPRRLRKVNEEAYTPQYVSIGPFHHDKPELLGMELHKGRCLDEFCKRTKKNQEDLTDFIRDHHKEILQSYGGPLDFKVEAFIEMVLVDACFIIELFLRNSMDPDDDYILNTTGRIRRDIELDLIMLENQLPYAFLKQLYDFVYSRQSPNSETTDDSGTVNEQIAEEVPLLSRQHHNGNGYIHPFSKLACKFFHYPEDVGEESDELEIKHFTDLVRRALCPMEINDTGTGKESENCLSYLCSAKKLDAAGVQFFLSKNSGLVDFEIESSNLSCIPCLKSTRLGLSEFRVEDGTECLLRNVMALEQYLYPCGAYICNYICLLDKLIEDTADVDLLVERKIVRNFLGSNDEVAKLVNNLGKEIGVDSFCYEEVCQKLNAHCDNWLNGTKATIRRVYFKDCWTGSTAIVGLCVLVFSICATIKTLVFN